MTPDPFKSISSRLGRIRRHIQSQDPTNENDGTLPQQPAGPSVSVRTSTSPSLPRQSASPALSKRSPRRKQQHKRKLPQQGLAQPSAPQSLFGSGMPSTPTASSSSYGPSTHFPVANPAATTQASQTISSQKLGSQQNPIDLTGGTSYDQVSNLFTISTQPISSQEPGMTVDPAPKPLHPNPFSPGESSFEPLYFPNSLPDSVDLAMYYPHSAFTALQAAGFKYGGLWQTVWPPQALANLYPEPFNSKPMDDHADHTPARSCDEKREPDPDQMDIDTPEEIGEDSADAELLPNEKATLDVILPELELLKKFVRESTTRSCAVCPRSKSRPLEIKDVVKMTTAWISTRGAGKHSQSYSFSFSLSLSFSLPALPYPQFKSFKFAFMRLLPCAFRVLTYLL
ncbi:hypothetical protein M426DRAFT_326094, partial [Hypoxylon sp. CI-4A]